MTADATSKTMMINSRREIFVRDSRSSVINRFPPLGRPVLGGGASLSCRMKNKRVSNERHDTGLLLTAVAKRDLVDNALHQHYAKMDVPGNIGQELGHEVVGRSRTKTDKIARGCSAAVRLNSRYIEIFKLSVDGKSQQVAVIEHASSVIALRPSNFVNSVRYPAPNTGVGHAMVMRILMGNRWNGKVAKELADTVFGVTRAHVFHKSQQARPIG